MILNLSHPEYLDYRVFLDRVDVTDFCVYADEATGEVVLEMVEEWLENVPVFSKLTDEQIGVIARVPKLRIEDGQLAQERKTGNVMIIHRKDLCTKQEGVPSFL